MSEKVPFSYISHMKIMIFRYRPLQNRGGGNYLDNFFRQGGIIRTEGLFGGGLKAVHSCASSLGRHKFLLGFTVREE